MTSLLARIEGGASSRGAITFLGSGGAERVPWGRLYEDARGVAAGLQARGVEPGDRVAILGPTSRALVSAIEATWLAGATLVAMPLPMRLGSLEEFANQTRTRIANADPRIVIVDPELEPFLTIGPDDPPLARLPDVRGRARDWERPREDRDALAILQFTSGSTADPKGVMLPHRCLVDNIDAIAEAAGLGMDDVGVSWLPLYHDMGLIGLLLTPMTVGFDLGLAPPQDFLGSPGLWMSWLSEMRATVTGGPNFAYALAGRAMRRLDGLDLSRWRMALNGAEPIDPDAVDRFVDAGARHGLDPKSAFCVYGMAEATLAISFPEPGTGMAVDTVDRFALEHERYASPAAAGAPGTKRLALLGRPLRGLELRVCDPESGAPLTTREVGEIEVRGTAVTPGYWRRNDLTEQTFHDGWLRTGDLGYLVDDEVVVCGRIKDVIIVGGRNVFPEEVERAAAAVDGVRAGNVIAFGTEGRRGKEGIVVVAETRADDPSLLHDEVVNHVCDVVGIPPLAVLLVAPGSLPKTSSGKLQRSRCRAQYLEGSFASA